MYEIPTSIEIDGRKFQIRNNGDYRVILDCFEVLKAQELDVRERLLACLLIFYQDFSTIEDIADLSNVDKLVTEMYNFFNCGSASHVGTQMKHSVIDWKADSQLICSAINNVAGKEVRAEPYIHWWTFMGYYTAIGESPISSIIKIRTKMLENKKLEKYEKEFKQRNPQYFVWNSTTMEESEADKLAREIWNSGG